MIGRAKSSAVNPFGSISGNQSLSLVIQSVTQFRGFYAPRLALNIIATA